MSEDPRELARRRSSALYEFQPKPPAERGGWRRRFRWVTVAVIGLGAVLGAAVLWLPRDWHDQRLYDREHGYGAFAGELTPSQRAQVTRELPGLERIVARVRGGRFVRPVRLQFLDDAAFRTELESGGGESDQVVATALGLSGSAYQHQQAAESSRHAVGLYSSSRQRLFIRGNIWDDVSRVVLVHELTHAYDDQATALHSLGEPISDEKSEAALALIEGDAVRVERVYIHTLPPGERCQMSEYFQIPFDPTCLAAGYRNADIAPANRLNAADLFPYVAGEHFVDALAAHGGEPAVDAAFGDPPVTTEQIIEPKLYWQHVSGVRVPPPAVAATGRSGSLGALGLSLVLDLSPPFTVSSYVAGWAGDSYRIGRVDHRRCTVDNVATRSVAARTRLERELIAWARVRLHRKWQRRGALIQIQDCA